VLLSAGAVVLAAGCGSHARQDAGERKGSFPIQVLGTSFPAHQAIAKPARFELRVRNAGSHTVPNIAVTLDSFSYASNYARLASNSRPIWAIEEGPGAQPSVPVESEAVSPPGGAQTAYLSTWALGPLAPESTALFEWHVVPVKSGTYTVHYTVAAGLTGKATAQTSSGKSVAGALTANIAPAPPSRHVDPKTGKVVPGQYSAVP
jgi:hypothetical protein